MRSVIIDDPLLSKTMPRDLLRLATGGPLRLAKRENFCANYEVAWPKLDRASAIRVKRTGAAPRARVGVSSMIT